MSLKKISLYSLGGLLLLVAAAAAWLLGPVMFPAKSLNVGIAVGARAPVEMALADSNGQPTTLGAQMGAQGMVVMMVRSADWCPFCKAQLLRTEKIRGAIAGQGYGLASVSYDQPEKLAAFAQAKGIGFAMLSDRGSKLIDALGLRDPQYGPDSYASGVPHPTVLVLAKDGTVKAKFVDSDYRSRQSNDQILAMLEDPAS